MPTEEAMPIWGDRADVGEPGPAAGRDVVTKINEARRHRRQPILDEAEARKVLENLARRAADPNHYRKWCWHCQAVVDEGTNEHCRECRWLVCWCGACRSTAYVDAQGQRGACRTGAWTLGIAADVPDLDFHGLPILTSRPPGDDAAWIRALTLRAGVGAVYHWSPARAVPSVLTHGLLAHPGLRRLGIDYEQHRYGSHEKELALGAYVATSLRPKQGMMSEWSTEPIVWELDPEVLVTAGALFLPDNSARGTLSVAVALAAQGAPAYELALNAYLSQGAQAELLVPDRVPRMAIRRVFVGDEALANEVLRLAERVGWQPVAGNDWVVAGEW